MNKEDEYMTNNLDNIDNYDFRDKNLLIISPSYPDENGELFGGLFVKRQADELKKYFKNIYVIAPVLTTRRFTKNGRASKNYGYDNVHVYFPYAFYIPLSILSAVSVDFRLGAVKSVIRKHNLKFDITHAHMSEPSGYIAMKLKEQYNVPYVITIHENTNWFEKEIAMQHPKIIDAWKNSDAVIRVNRGDVPKLKEYNQNTYAVVNGYSPNFLPMNPYECRDKLSVPKDKKVIFTLGFLTERKGFQFLIEAMSEIVKERNDVLCYIGGSGEYRKNLESLIHEYGVEDFVFLLGIVSDEDVTLRMNACDLFVLPSLSESFGIVNIEALACGKPVVASNVGGIPEIIISDEYGFLCTPGDVKELTDIVLKALNKEWDKAKILEYAKGYRWSEVCKEILEIYRQISPENGCGTRCK